MKFCKFNKIGDTSYRTKLQIKSYICFAEWYTRFWNENKRYPNDVDFRTWVKKCENPYNYKNQNNDKIKNRLDLVLKNAISKYKLIKCDSDRCSFSLTSNNDYYNEILNKLADSNGSDTCVAFRAMLEFMIKYPKFNVAKRIAFAFFTFEKGDDFCSLYSCTITDLVKKVFGKYTAQEIINRNFLMKKSTRMKQIRPRILRKSLSFAISDDEFQYLLLNKHLPKVLDSKSKFESYIKEKSFDEIVRTFLTIKFKKLLYGEYFDLFNRVMFELNLANKYGKNVRYYNNDALHFDTHNNNFYVEQQVKYDKLPYSYEEINTNLQKITNKDFSFIKNDIHLSCIPAYDIVEYFVNLKICAIFFKVPINEIKNCVNTILDKDNYPICHAPGRRSDMLLKNIVKETLLSFETTTHANRKTIIRNELDQCFTHLAAYKPPYNKNILFVVLPQNNDVPFIMDYFKSVAKVWTNQIKREFSTKILTFGDLVNIHKPEQLLSLEQI